MSKLFTVQGITALLTILSMIAALFGKDQLAAFFTDTDTAQTILGILSILGVSGLSVMPPVTEEPK